MKYALPVALLCVGFLGGYWASTARLTPRMQARQTRIAVLEDRLAREREDVQQGVVRLDTVTIPKWRTRYDTAIVRLTDTVRVKEALAAADTAITACRVILSDCERLAATERERGDSLEAQVRDALRLARPRLSKNLYIAGDPDGGIYVGGEVRARVFGLEGFVRGETRVDSASSQLRGGLIFRF